MSPRMSLYYHLKRLAPEGVKVERPLGDCVRLNGPVAGINRVSAAAKSGGWLPVVQRFEPDGTATLHYRVRNPRNVKPKGARR